MADLLKSDAELPQNAIKTVTLALRELSFG
jgi:hypothetical protein